MPRRKSARKKITVHVSVDEEVFYFFKSFLLSPTEGRIKYGFSDLVNRLLREEQKRVTAPLAQPTPPKEPTDASPNAGTV